MNEINFWQLINFSNYFNVCSLLNRLSAFGISFAYTSLWYISFLIYVFIHQKFVDRRWCKCSWKLNSLHVKCKHRLINFLNCDWWYVWRRIHVLTTQKLLLNIRYKNGINPVYWYLPNLLYTSNVVIYTYS